MTEIPQEQRRALRVCMLAYAFYESDTRIMQYATALTRRGDQVDVIALRRDARDPELHILDGVNVYRIQARRVNEKGLLAYAYRILTFLARSTRLLWRKNRQTPYDLIHVHNVPDFLVFGALGPKLSGVPVILDVHDLLPEFYASKFKVAHDSFLFRLLVFVERCSAAFANHIIIANDLWRDRLAARSAKSSKCSVVRNYPDLQIFIAKSQCQAESDGKFVLTYPGSLNGHQGLDVAIRAFVSIMREIPDAEFHIYGEGPAKPSLIALARELQAEKRIIFHDFLPSVEIAQVMAKTDLAIEPKRSTSAFGNEALSTKILEFLALGVPVVASKTRIHAFYYDDSVVQYYENDDESALAKQILALKLDPARRRELIENGRRYAEANNWDARKAEYLRLADTLVQPGQLKTPSAAKSRPAGQPSSADARTTNSQQC